MFRDAAWIFDFSVGTLCINWKLKIENSNLEISDSFNYRFHDIRSLEIDDPFVKALMGDHVVYQRRRESSF